METDAINDYFHEFDECMKKGDYKEAGMNLQLLELRARQIEGHHKKWVRDEIIACKSQLLRTQLLEKETTNIKSKTALDLLVESRQQLAESEQVAIDTVTNLHEQREKLEKVRANLKEANDDLTRSNTVLNRMSSFWRR